MKQNDKNYYKLRASEFNYTKGIESYKPFLWEIVLSKDN